MQCWICQNPKSQVTNSRSTSKGQQVWRRRRCNKCKNEWSTYEAVDSSKSIIVKDDLGESKPLSRDELLMMIFGALSWRKDARSISGPLTDTVLSKVLAESTTTISESEINAIIHKVLKNFDKTAGEVFLKQK